MVCMIFQHVISQKCIRNSIVSLTCSLLQDSEEIVLFRTLLANCAYLSTFLSPKFNQGHQYYRIQKVSIAELLVISSTEAVESSYFYITVNVILSFQFVVPWFVTPWTAQICFIIQTAQVCTTERCFGFSYATVMICNIYL